MQYDFDTPIDRIHTWSIKHDFKKENGKAEDILPLWVADMDFRSPDSVVEALKKAVDHGIFGYSRADESYFDAVAAWYQKRHHLTLQPEWMTCTPGIVFALSIADGDVEHFYHLGLKRVVCIHQMKMINQYLKDVLILV